MTLQSARLTGDKVLENCLAGTHRMLQGETNELSVLRVQEALLSLGYSVGPTGADGIFGRRTGEAVTAYKTAKRLTPNDPVIGRLTARALDNDLYFDPPYNDPTFAEFSPFVVNHRLEQFVARELLVLFNAEVGLNSWRRMLGRFALKALSSGELLGIVASSRVVDLRIRFLEVANPVQPDPGTGESIAAEVFFTRLMENNWSNSHGYTSTFFVGDQPRALIIISDNVILGRVSFHQESNNTHAPATLLGVVIHELTHARNLVNIQALLGIADTDTAAYADTTLAQTQSATGVQTSRVLRSYVAEITARHVHWVVLRELAGTPGGIAIRTLPAEQLAAAAYHYFTKWKVIYDINGYGAGINAQGVWLALRQIELWLRLCAVQSFSEEVSENEQAQMLFQKAAQVCADQLANRTLDLDASENGVFPLPQDFH
jgi:hypothetical protein